MIYYHSGAVEFLVSKRENTEINMLKSFDILTSYFYISKSDRVFNFLKEQRGNMNNVLLDSGAYSAFTQNKNIKLSTYLKWLEKHMHHFTDYIALDVIGDAEKTWLQFLEMKKLGFKPLPVWHANFSDVEYFKRYVDAGEEYICFGGVAASGVSNQTTAELDKAFLYLREKGLVDKVKIHGLGVGNQGYVERYPWYSIDSSNVLFIYKTCNIALEGKKYYIGETRGNPDYYLNPPTIERDYFLNEMKKNNIDIERAKTDNYYRYLVDVFFFNQWFNNLKHKIDFDGIESQSTLF